MMLHKLYRRNALGIALAVMFFAGCGAQNGANAMPQGAMQAQAHSVAGSNGDLLYVVCCSPSASEVTMLSYPKGRVVGTIQYVDDPFGICSDSSGNVWVVYVGQYAFEYPHGGTTPIASVWVPNTDLATDCASDPSTGDLAVINYGSPSGSSVDVFPNAQGPPNIYPVNFVPWSCSFDDSGDLFLDGFSSGSDTNFQFAELPKGSSTFRSLTLKGISGWAAAVRWDGKYIAVGVTEPQFKTRVYRVKVSGSKATVVETLDFRHMEQQPDFWIRGGTIVAGTGHHEGGVALWHYNHSGSPYERIHGIHGRYVTISVAAGLSP